MKCLSVYSLWLLFALVMASCQNNPEKEKKGALQSGGKERATPETTIGKDTSSPDIQETEKEKALIAATKEFPDSSLVWENLVQFYRENGNYKSARGLTEEILKKYPRNARWFYIKATLAYEDEDSTTAIRAFEKAAAISHNPDYFIALATLYAETKNPGALHIANELLAGSKKNADKDAFFIKGLYYSHLGEKQKAINYFNKALEQSYTFMDAYREKALALYSQGKYNEALDVLNKALTIMNSWDEGYYYSGLVLEKLNKKEDAIISYKNALAISPDYVEAREALDRLGVH